jgi:hypothetical protein
MGLSRRNGCDIFSKIYWRTLRKSSLGTKKKADAPSLAQLEMRSSACEEEQLGNLQIVFGNVGAFAGHVAAVLVIGSGSE